MTTLTTERRDDDVAYCAGGSGVCGCHAQQTPRYTKRSRVSRIVKGIVALGVIVYLLIAAVGCESTKPEASNTEATKAEAWDFFEQRDYARAEALFREVLASKPADSEARTGRGWSLIQLRTLEGAITVLRLVPPTDSTWYTSARAGLAVAYDAAGQFGNTIAPIDEALTHDSAWVFFHDPRVDWRDLEYLRARNHLMLSSQIDPSLETTVAALNRLTSDALPAVPELDPVNPATWTAGGVSYVTLAEAVLKRLEHYGKIGTEESNATDLTAMK